MGRSNFRRPAIPRQMPSFGRELNVGSAKSPKVLLLNTRIGLFAQDPIALQHTGTEASNNSRVFISYVVAALARLGCAPRFRAETTSGKAQAPARPREFVELDQAAVVESRHALWWRLGIGLCALRVWRQDWDKRPRDHQHRWHP